MRRLLPAATVAALLGAVLLAWYASARGVLSWSVLHSNEAALRAAAADRPLLAQSAYVLLYVGVTALSIPGAVLLSLAGGLLFGAFHAIPLIVAGATLGATLLFLIARSVLGAPLRARASPLIERVRPGLERDGFNYLLSLRLIPVVPFWLANLAPALAGMRLLPFVLATAIGIVPGAALLASIGAGLGDSVGEPDLSTLLAPRVLLPRLGLAALALAPVAWRAWRRRRG